MKQKLLTLTTTIFLCLVHTLHSQESLDYKIIESYNSFLDSYSLSEKEEYTYNTNGQLIKAERYFWDSTAWAINSRDEFEYDANGNLTERTFATWNSTTNQWINNYKDVNTYLSNEIIGQTGYEWEGGDWEPDYKTDMIYVANRIENFNSFDWNGTQWIDSERGVVSYNLGRISGTTTEEFVSNTWSPYEKTVYTRNASGRILEVTSQMWNGADWDNDEKEGFTLDASGNRLSETYSDSDDGTTWELYSKIDYTYNTSVLMSNYLEPFSVGSYFYDLGVEDFPHHNKVTSSVESEHNGTAWEISSKTTYYYSDDTMGLNDLSNSNFVTLYPNPAKNTLNIKLKDQIDAQASLYDVNGRLILEQKLQAINTPLNIESLQSGMYVLKIATENSFATKRVTKN
ncbi:T9SS type A sorting domain-containing protein [Gelidibacter japonicus]|uniref:T9SS type A sorting domain-containing protein n=1 Tax=Gelidibacter japonicus TaxID=1962232 RepID=UPI003A8CF2CA